MKLRIIFCEPPINKTQATEDETIIAIPSPYKIIQAELGDTREYETSDGIKMGEDFTYEQYCRQMNQLIQTTLHGNNPSGSIYDQITIEGFREPANFKAVCTEMKKMSLHCAPNSQIIFENCAFGGKLYTDSASNLICSLQKEYIKHHQAKLVCHTIIHDSEKTYLSKHDQFRLGMLPDVAFQYADSKQFIKPFNDDSLIDVKQTPLTAKLESPTFFYHQTMRTMQNQTTAEIALKNFFSQEAQQQSDYTCGPATVKMVASYFDSMGQRTFCNAPIANPTVWHDINKMPEMALAEQVNTNEAEGSGIPEIRDGLVNMGITVFDDSGLSSNEHSDNELTAHKQQLLEKIEQLLKLGIPVILNMQDKGGCGHFEVAIGMEKNAQPNHIILAEPGTALVGALEFENLPTEQFMARWKNMSGEFHGRFMILSPNEETTQNIATILADMPHNETKMETIRQQI